MQMAATCKTCLKTGSYTATGIWRLHARPTPRCQESIKMDIIKVKCDPHSADVEIDPGGGGLWWRKEQIAVCSTRGIYWLASSIRFCCLQLVAGFVGWGLFVCLSVCLSVGQSVGLSVGRLVGSLLNRLVRWLLASLVVSFAGCLIAIWMVSCLLGRLFGWLFWGEG